MTKNALRQIWQGKQWNNKNSDDDDCYSHINKTSIDAYIQPKAKNQEEGVM